MNFKSSDLNAKQCLDFIMENSWPGFRIHDYGEDRVIYANNVKTQWILWALPYPYPLYLPFIINGEPIGFRYKKI